MPFNDEDAACMRLAIEASRQARAAGNMPFGASLVKDGQVLWTSRNNQVSTGDCTGHAEVVLIREAASQLSPEVLKGATVYASGEPCAMCAGAMFWAGIRRVVYGATTPDIEAALGGGSLPARCADVLADCRPAVLVEGPLLRDEAVAALRSG